MRCPKCGYVSFDSNLECPKCRFDISKEQGKLNLPSFMPSIPFFLRKLLGSEDSRAEPFSGETEEPPILDDESPERTDDEWGMFQEEEFTPEGEGETAKSPGAFAPPSHALKHIEEIKELISELMPAKNDTESQNKKQ